MTVTGNGRWQVQGVNQLVYIS